MNAEVKKVGKKRGRKSGGPISHGAYSLLVTGEYPDSRKDVARWLSVVRRTMIHDLGPTESDLTAAQLVLIDRAIGKLGVIRCVEEHVRKTGVIQNGNVAPVLRDVYLAYSNSLRLDLMALGIARRHTGDVLDVHEYIEKFDKRERAEEQGEERPE
jgi:hypothetical protein